MLSEAGSQSEGYPLQEHLTVYPGAGRIAGDSKLQPLHLAIGMFDGVHIGHQAVIRQAIEASNREEGHCSAVLTFDPHPSRVLYPKEATPLLIPLSTRISRIHSLGTDFVFVQQFTREYAEQEAVEFVPSLSGMFPQLQSIHVGENFRFGHGRSGNVDTLRKTASEKGIRLHALQRKSHDEMAISSSRIRAELIEGTIRTVNCMLGDPYMIRGRISTGNGVGRTLGFPTLNIPWNPEVSPRFGVYLVQLGCANLDRAPYGIANYGMRPTINTTEKPILEVHLLDAPKLPATGDMVEVRLLDFIRPEKKFETVDALKKQIARDIEAVKTMLEQSRSSS